MYPAECLVVSAVVAGAVPESVLATTPLSDTSVGSAGMVAAVVPDVYATVDWHVLALKLVSSTRWIVCPGASEADSVNWHPPAPSDVPVTDCRVAPAGAASYVTRSARWRSADRTRSWKRLAST